MINCKYILIDKYKKTKQMKKILLSSAALLFCVCVMAQNSVNLKMNLEKNKVYRFNTVSEQTILQTVNGNQQTVDSKTNYTLSLKMMDVTPGFMVCEVRFDTLITITNAMGKASNITSVSEGDIKSAETSEVMSCIMNRISKNALYVKMDFTGKVIEIVNLKMLSDAVLKDTASIALAGPVAAAVKKQIVNLVSENTLKTMIEMFSYFLPGKQVNTGDNWNISVSTNSGGMLLDIVTNFHLDGMNANAANITAESDIKAAAGAGPMESGGATITYDDLKGLSKSTLVIDILTGLIVEEKSKTHIAGNLGVTVPGMSLQIPMEINGTSKVTALQ
jgi:hypothetical protein